MDRTLSMKNYKEGDLVSGRFLFFRFAELIHRHYEWLPQYMPVACIVGYN